MGKLRRLIISFLILIMSLRYYRKFDDGISCRHRHNTTRYHRQITQRREGEQEIDLGSLQNCVVRVKDHHVTTLN